MFLNKFNNYRAGERIVLILRRHKIFFIKAVFQLSGILILLMILLYFFGKDLGNSFLIILFALIIILLLIVYWFFLWTNDLFIITDQRLIDIDQNSIFSRVVTETDHDKIQNVSYEVKGILPTFFNFGKIIIETAGPTENVIIELVPNPSKVVEDIKNAANLYCQHHQSFSGISQSWQNNIPKGENQ